MSETIGSASTAGRDTAGTGTGASAGTAGSGGAPVGVGGQNTTEAYSFACMNCGFGWEQAYEIEHHVDAFGRPFITYLADGVRVPSPLTRPICRNCDGHHVRIMRSGQVADLAAQWVERRGGDDALEPRGEAGERRAVRRSALRFLHHHHRGHGEAQSG